MARHVVWTLARFAVIYGALVFMCALLPVYAWIERAATVVAAAPLAERSGESRVLRFEPRADPPSYVYELRLADFARELQRPYHKHGFVLVLFVALALATPGLGLRRGALFLTAGAAAAFLLCVAMLMSDVELWERGVVAEAGLPPTAGPYALPFGFVQGLHRTAAAGLLPVILWVFLVSRRGASPGRRSSATSAA